MEATEALTSVHGGRIYYFGSKENRERFEASPEAYAARATAETSDHAGRCRPRPAPAAARLLAPGAESPISAGREAHASWKQWVRYDHG